PEGLRKNQYRKFNIRNADLMPGDDYGMMREVLERRFKRLLTEHPRATDAAQPSPLVGEGGEPHGGEPGEGAAPQSEFLTRPRSASPPLGHSLPQGERESEPAATSDDDGESPWPDLVVIDGGQGQLRA